MRLGLVSQAFASWLLAEAMTVMPCPLLYFSRLPMASSRLSVEPEGMFDTPSTPATRNVLSVTTAGDFGFGFPPALAGRRIQSRPSMVICTVGCVGMAEFPRYSSWTLPHVWQQAGP